MAFVNLGKFSSTLATRQAIRRPQRPINDWKKINCSYSTLSTSSSLGTTNFKSSLSEDNSIASESVNNIDIKRVVRTFPMLSNSDRSRIDSLPDVTQTSSLTTANNQKLFNFSHSDIRPMLGSLSYAVQQRHFSSSDSAAPPKSESESNSNSNKPNPKPPPSESNPFLSKKILTVTPSAAARVIELMSLDDRCSGIKVSLRQRGCSGMSYVMDFMKSRPGKFDEVINVVGEDGKKGTVFVDAKAVLFLVGTEMDYVEVEMGSEFVFRNPNSKGACGCGQSFNV